MRTPAPTQKLWLPPGLIARAQAPLGSLCLSQEPEGSWGSGMWLSALCSRLVAHLGPDFLGRGFLKGLPAPIRVAVGTDSTAPAGLAAPGLRALASP